MTSPIETGKADYQKLVTDHLWTQALTAFFIGSFFLLGYSNDIDGQGQLGGLRSSYYLALAVGFLSLSGLLIVAAVVGLFRQLGHGLTQSLSSVFSNAIIVGFVFAWIWAFDALKNLGPVLSLYTWTGIVMFLFLWLRVFIFDSGNRHLLTSFPGLLWAKMNSPLGKPHHSEKPDIIIMSRDQLVGTLRHLAVMMGSKRLAELLIEAGADMNAPDFDGYTPLYAALSSPELEPNTKIEIAEFLRKNGRKYPRLTVGSSSSTDQIKVLTLPGPTSE